MIMSAVASRSGRLSDISIVWEKSSYPNVAGVAQVSVPRDTSLLSFGR